MITKKMTIAEAIKSNPDIIQILSDANIDYCCGGHRPLLEAAEEKNLDVDSFVDLLNRQKETENRGKADPLTLDNEKLIDYIIKKHHIPELDMLEEIDQNLRKLINVHYEKHGEALSDIYHIFMSMKMDLIPHFAKEEKREFPDFLSGKEVDFSELEKEHEHVGQLLKTLSEKTDNYTAPDDGCFTYRRTFELMKGFQDDIHNHIFLENSVLFLR